MEEKITNMPELKRSGFISHNMLSPFTEGELSGLSFAIKDNIDIANEVTGYGSPSWANTHTTPVINAICLDQLLSKGATCLGKTLSDELAYSLIGVNHFYGAPLNPKAPDRVPGGSSSGSASVVASELVDFAIGTDTGGSIRVPASNCGIWGYRPSHGLISTAGVLALAPSFDTVGIVAQTGEILKKIVQALLAETSNKNEITSSIYFVEDVFQIADKQILEAIKPTMNKISKLCKSKSILLAEITDKHVNCEWLFEQSGLLMSAEIWNTFGSWIEHEKPKLSPGVEYAFNNYAKTVRRSDMQNSLCTKRTFSKKLNNFLYSGNILCFPTTVDLAPKLDDITPEFMTGDYIPRAMGVNAISGLSQTPQITIPIAEVHGVPIGVSFVAGYGQDMILVNFCNELQKQFGICS